MVSSDCGACGCATFFFEVCQATQEAYVSQHLPPIILFISLANWKAKETTENYK